MKRKRNVNEIEISDWMLLEFSVPYYRIFHTMYTYLFYCVCEKKCRFLFYTITLLMIECYWSLHTNLGICKAAF